MGGDAHIKTMAQATSWMQIFLIRIAYEYLENLPIGYFTKFSKKVKYGIILNNTIDWNYFNN